MKRHLWLWLGGALACVSLVVHGQSTANGEWST